MLRSSGSLRKWASIPRAPQAALRKRSFRRERDRQTTADQTNSVRRPSPTSETRARRNAERFGAGGVCGDRGEMARESGRFSERRSSQERARAALARVSAVVNVFDATMKKVVPGVRPASTASRSAGSMLETKCSFGPDLRNLRIARTSIRVRGPSRRCRC